MIIGIPKEIKNNENRVAITPAGVKTFCGQDHTVLIEENAGVGSSINNEDYQQAGAEIVKGPEDVFDRAEMILKVKEPLPEEYDYFREEQLLFTYLHLAADENLTRTLMAKKVVAIAYETVQKEEGSLPLLTPMSEVAGRLAVQAGARFLEKPQGGKGILPGGVPGVKPAKVVIIGGGTVGINAAKMAVGLGADVTILEIDSRQMRYLDDIFSGRVKTIMSGQYNIRREVKKADLLIGAVLLPGRKAPHIISEDMIKEMDQGSVVVDVAIDQGGCIETTHPTTHDNPVFKKHGVLHYSVGNMPGAVPETSTYALTNVTIPYALAIANKGYRQAFLDDYCLAQGLNIIDGRVVNRPVAETFDMEYYELDKVLESFK